jgi:Tol biopolymer transport system component
VHRYDPSLRVQALSPRVGRDALFYLSAFGARDGLWKFQGGEPEQIWDGSQGAVINSPAESRDGHLAFAVKMGQSWVLTVKEKNGGIRTLATSIDVRGFPAWSPDGRWIAVGGINGEGMRGLFKIPLDGGPAVTLVSKKFVTDPTWSNDGDLIVYAGQDEAAKVPLGVVRLSDRSEVKLPQQVFGTPGLARPRFLPDGSGVIFVATDPNLQDNTRLPEFWLLDLKKGVTRQLTRIAGDTTRGEIRGFDLTPDGKQIVFERLVENSDIQLITLPDPATR